jgi:hypothetical protein
MPATTLSFSLCFQWSVHRLKPVPPSCLPNPACPTLSGRAEVEDVPAATADPQ